MTTDTETPRAWVGCLACYNGGALIGEWFDGEEAGDVTAEDLHRMHFAPGTGPASSEHEELWVLDHENYHGLLTGECSPAEAQRLAEILDEQGHLAPAFAAYASHVGDVEYARESFEEAYAGEWDSEREYAEELADELGLFRDVIETLSIYFDYEAWTRDLFMSDYFSTPAPGGGVYVFRNL